MKHRHKQILQSFREANTLIDQGPFRFGAYLAITLKALDFSDVEIALIFQDAVGLDDEQVQAMISGDPLQSFELMRQRGEATEETYALANRLARKLERK